MRNLTHEHTEIALPITSETENRVMQAIIRTGRSERWFDYDAACNWLTRHPDASAETAIRLFDYSVPRTIVTEWYERYSDTTHADVTTECWREHEGRIWRVQFNEEYGSAEALVREASAPGDDGLHMTESGYYEDNDLGDTPEPTLAQLGL